MTSWSLTSVHRISKVESDARKKAFLRYNVRVSNLVKFIPVISATQYVRLKQSQQTKFQPTGL